MGLLIALHGVTVEGFVGPGWQVSSKAQKNLLEPFCYETNLSYP